MSRKASRLSNTYSPATDPRNIRSVPTEIIEFIAENYLARSDIIKLRSTCRTLEQRTYHVFCRTFKTIYSNLSHKSLKNLQEMAKHDLIKESVQCLVLRGGHYINKHTGTPPSGHLPQPFTNFPLLAKLLRDEFTKCRSFRIICTNSYSGGNFDYELEMLFFHMVNREEIRPKRVDLRESCNSILRYWDPKHSAVPKESPISVSAWAELENLNIKHSLSRRAAFMSCFLALKPTYPCLQKITLLDVKISSQTLLILLFCCKDTLRSLYIHNLETPIGGIREWRSFFTEMASHFPVLESLCLVHLLCESENENPGMIDQLVFPRLGKDEAIPGMEPLCFSVSRTKPKHMIVGVRYQGQLMNKVWDILAETMSYRTVSRNDYI